MHVNKWVAWVAGFWKGRERVFWTWEKREGCVRKEVVERLQGWYRFLCHKHRQNCLRFELSIIFQYLIIYELSCSVLCVSLSIKKIQRHFPDIFWLPLFSLFRGTLRCHLHIKCFKYCLWKHIADYFLYTVSLKNHHTDLYLGKIFRIFIPFYISVLTFNNCQMVSKIFILILMNGAGAYKHADF